LNIAGEGSGSPAVIQDLEELFVLEHPRKEVILQVFGFASATPQWNLHASRTLEEFAELLEQYPSLEIRIEGHGQPGAPEPIASTLAWQRADFTAEELNTRHNVPRNRMDVLHQSNNCPRYLDDPDANRRVELSVYCDRRNKAKAKARREEEADLVLSGGRVSDLIQDYWSYHQGSFFLNETEEDQEHVHVEASQALYDDDTDDDDAAAADDDDDDDDDNDNDDDDDDTTSDGSESDSEQD